MTHRLQAIAVLLCAPLGACSDSAVPSSTPAHLIASAGDGQTARAGDTLPQLLALRALDGTGSPLAGHPVQWSSAQGGSFDSVDSITDVHGMARARWQLGIETGIQTAQARLLGFEERATFQATATRSGVLKAVALMRGAPAGHMCAVDVDGQAWCWGENEVGQIGNGTHTTSATAVPTSGSARFTQLAGTQGTTCGLTGAGAIWCWGLNTRIMGLAEPALVPTRVQELALGDHPTPPLVSLDLENGSACGVSVEGEGYCWGDGPIGAGEGPGIGIGWPVPYPVTPIRRWRAIALGETEACAVTQAGDEVFCWGPAADNHERFGVGDGLGYLGRPALVLILSRLHSLSVNPRNQCGITGGTVVCWGLDLPGVAPPGPAFISPGGYAVLRYVSEGGMSMALAVDGRLWAGSVALSPAGPWRDFAISTFGVFGILAADSTVYSWQRDGLDGAWSTTPRPVAVP